MNVFLTGATGYIGSTVAEKLKRAGHDVLGLARSDESSRALETAGHRVQRGDLADYGSLADAARATDATIHAAATGGPDQPELDRKATVALLDALEGTGKPFIYTDGVWVLGDTGDNIADENSHTNPIDLVAWRPAMVDRVLAADLRGIVIRPGIVYGRGGGIPAMMIAWGEQRGAVPYIADGAQRWPFVHVDALADLYLRALTDALAGTLLHAAHGNAITMKEVAEAASHPAGVPGKTVSWPLDHAREALGGFADALALDQRISADRAHTLLGWDPEAPPPLEDIRAGSYA